MSVVSGSYRFSEERSTMKTLTPICKPATKLLAVSLVILISQYSLSQDESAALEEQGVANDQHQSGGMIEELTVLGRYKAASTDIVSERLEQDVPVDYIDAEFIARLGDSNVADALRRVPGLTLVDGKFIYIRGLGERYSSAQLNGANVPSPDVTRNVIPLNIFPADIIDSVAVQKGYSAELGASFGGGNIDIRTKQIPEEFTFKLGLKTGVNGASDKGYYYQGGDDDVWGTDDGTRALPHAISAAIDTYRGSFEPLQILTTPIDGGSVPNISAARGINRALATNLSRNIDLQSKSLDEDIEAEGLLGHRIFVNDALSFGYLLLGTYSNDWRNKERTNRLFSNPETNFSETLRTTQSVNITGSLNIGVSLTDDHEFGVKGLLIRNTEDDASSSRTCSQGQFNDCFDDESPVQGRITGIRFEERQLEMLQYSGRHTIGDDSMRGVGLGWDFLEYFIGTTLTWYHTHSTAETSIPNEIRLSGQETLQGPNGTVDTYRVRRSGTSADYRFSDLYDDVESYGWDIEIPLDFATYTIELLAGSDFTYKLRNYKQTSLGMGSTTPAFRDISEASPSEVFSNQNIINPDLGFELLLGVAEFGTESYVAMQAIEASYGKFDVFVNDTWRLSGGVRREVFNQISIPIDYLEYESSRIALNLEEGQSVGDTLLETDEYYPSFSLTYIRPGFWSDEFQFRVGVSQTVVRPDIREMSASTFIDPITEARVRGNPNLSVTDLRNFDLRAEWYFSSGDNFTASLFLKDIVNPIETVQGGATEDNVLFNFVNAEDASVYGMEFEFLKSLDGLADHMGDWLSAFYIAGNVTVSDSEISIQAGDGVGNITNSTRRLTQQSNWVTNLQLGYDSFNGKHGATLAFNSFGERIYFAGTDGLPDGYEQPFHSLDLIYTYYPIDNWTFKLRVKNILDEAIEVAQGDVAVIEQSFGRTALLNVKWEF